MSDFQSAPNASVAPIALFVYNRPEHTRRTLQSLAATHGAKDSELTIFSDAAKTKNVEREVEAVREIIADVRGFRSVEIIVRPENKGAAGSVIDGINYMLARHERAIFLEDDLVCAPHALTFLNDCLEQYADQPNILAASAYNYPSTLMKIPESYEYDAYFSPGFFSWGWATWRRALAHVDWSVSDYDDFLASPSQLQAFQEIGGDLPDLLERQQRGELDDWVLPFTYSLFKNSFLTIRPTRSLIDNIGHDGSGLHCKSTELFRNDISGAGPINNFPKAVFVDKRLMRSSRFIHSRSPFYRAARRILDLMWRTRKWVTGQRR